MSYSTRVERFGLPASRHRADTVVRRRVTREDRGMTPRAEPERHLRASARSETGSLRHEVAIDGGRHVLVTDEPEHLGGGGPAPHELFPATQLTGSTPPG